MQERKREVNQLLSRSRDLSDCHDIDGRWALAKTLVRAHEYDEALTHYVWLWTSTRPIPAKAGVRLSSLLADIADLAEKHSRARDVVFGLLEALHSKVLDNPLPPFEEWAEWSAMCEALWQRRRIVDWYERWRNPHGQLFEGRATDHRQARMAAQVFDALMGEERPVDAVRVLDDWKPYAQELIQNSLEGGEILKGQRTQNLIDEKVFGRLQDARRRHVVTKLAELYAALLVDGRVDQAAQIAQVLLCTWDDVGTRLALVMAGIEISHRATDASVRWLNEAEALGANVDELRKRLLADKEG